MDLQIKYQNQLQVIHLNESVDELGRLAYLVWYLQEPPIHVTLFYDRALKSWNWKQILPVGESPKPFDFLLAVYTAIGEEIYG